MAARIASILTTALVGLYALIYIAASIFALVAGVTDPVGSTAAFGAEYLQTQLPLLLLLGFAWVICVLADSLRIGTVWGSFTDGLPWAGTSDVQETLLRVAENWHGLVSPTRINSLISLGLFNGLLAVQTPLSPHMVGWTPGVHPSLHHQ